MLICNCEIKERQKREREFCKSLVKLQEKNKWKIYCSDSNCLYELDIENCKKEMVFIDATYSMLWYYSISHDGKKIAYSKWIKAGKKIGLVIGNLETSKRKTIFTINREITYSSWSPDDEKIIFLVHSESQREKECGDLYSGDLYICNLYKKEVKRIIKDKIAVKKGPPSWINKNIVLVVSSDGKILRVNLNTLKCEEICKGEFPVYLKDNFIVCVINDKIYRVDIKSKEKVLLIDDRNFVRGRIDISPCKRFIIYACSYSLTPPGAFGPAFTGAQIVDLKTGEKCLFERRAYNFMWVGQQE